jgi:DNA-binding NtrC family response regulator
MPKRILLLDTADGDLDGLAATFNEASSGELWKVTEVSELLEKLKSGLPFDLIVVDHELGDGVVPGRDVLAHIREVDTDTPVIAVAEEGNVELAAEAIEAGASDFLVRGARLERRVSTLLAKVRSHLALIETNRVLGEHNRLLQEAALARFRLGGESPQIAEVIERIHRVATIPRPVLITGERGTGKELVARAIHEASGRSSRPLVVVNCAAFPDSLLESELFGHEKGAFTGADAIAIGKFELAREGTLFLDEQKILRVVEYKTFTRVGGKEELRTDTRILAATNMDLKARMEEGDFLRDLYDRLTFEIIHVPPLRERMGDVEILARTFLASFGREIPVLSGKRLTPEALETLRRYGFPGNVRELKNIIERAAYRGEGAEITPADLGLAPGAEAEAEGGNFEERVEGFKKRLIRDALEKASGNQARAARSLGLSYHQFRYYNRKYSK